jgi:hypothetical protein
MGIVLDPIKCFPLHPTEEILEEYVFDRLPEDRAAQVEEHLLICQSCQDAVAETDRFVSALKATVGHPDIVHFRVPAIGRVRRGWRNVLDGLPRFATNRTGLVPILLVAILALLVVREQREEPATPVAVTLTSVRGLNPLSLAPARKPLLLSIDAPDLTPGREYRVELVDATGRAVWKGAVTETDGKLVATMSKPLRKGVYWARLYGTGSELLREFGISSK